MNADIHHSTTAIAAWLGSGALRATVLIAAAALGAVLLRRRSAAVRHAVWTASIVLALAAAFAGPFLPSWSVPLRSLAPARNAGAAFERPVRSEPAARGSGISGDRSTAAMDPVATPVRSSSVPWATFLVGVWILGFGVFATRLVTAHRRLGRFVRESRALDGEAVPAPFAATGSLTELRVSSALDVPVACGLVRGAVLLPEDSERWSAGDLRRVVLHERAHLERRDPLWLALSNVACAVWWFHPLVWLAARAMRRESERACDDAVLRAGEKPSRYAGALLGVASGVRRPAPHALALSDRSDLGARIEDVLAVQRDRRPLGVVQGAALALLAVPLAALIATAQPAFRSGPYVVRADDLRGAPVEIHRATVEIAAAPDHDPGRVRITAPRLELTLPGTRRVSRLQLGFDLEPWSHDRIWQSVDFGAGDAVVDVPERIWSMTVPAENVSNLRVYVAAVRFEDGTTWQAPQDFQRRPSRSVPSTPGWWDVDSPSPSPSTSTPAWWNIDSPSPSPPRSTANRSTEPPTPSPSAAPSTSRAPTPRPTPVAQPSPSSKTEVAPPPAADEASAAEEIIDHWVPARFRNPDGAPIVIVDAKTPVRAASWTESGKKTTLLPQVTLDNRTGRRVVIMRIRYKADDESHAVTGTPLVIEPRGTVSSYSIRYFWNA